MDFGVTRTWTNLASTANGFSGSGMLIDQLPHLRQDPGGTLTAVANGFNVRYFDYNGTSYTARFFVQDTFSADSANHQYVQTDSAGDVIKYNDFTVTPANEQGAFKSFTDANGNTISVTSWTGDGKVQEVQRSSGSLIESELYSYLSNGVNAGLVSSVVLRRSTNGGTTWTTVRQVQYTYYGGEAHGNVGDLKLAQVQDGSGNTLDTTYYRYYTGESGGYTHGLKYVFRPDSYARLVAAQGSNIDNISDANAAPYADDYFEYDTSQRVTRHTVAGDGGTVGSNGLGSYTYAYTASSNAAGFNSWATKTTETLPDGNQNLVYTNAYGEIMLKVYDDVQGSGNQWLYFTKYDGSGRALLLAQPSAVTGYNDTYADLLNYSGGSYQYLSSSTGLITDLDYGTSTTATQNAAGDALGYDKDTKIQQGQTGSAITLTGQQYFLRAGSTINTFPVANDTRYRNTDGTGGETTSYSYTFYTGQVQPREVDTTLPSVPQSENGPGFADTSSLVFDSYGRPEWSKDGDGRLFYTAYDQASGAVTKQITDVNTNDTGDFTDLPTNWSSGSNPLHLITLETVDALGRTTKETDPDGNVTYTVYNDTNYEVLVYPGWNGSTGIPTGPTELTRQDRPGSYTETLTMSAAPHLAAAPAAPVLSQTSGGSLPATTYYVKLTYIVNGGETAAGAESSLAVAANSLLQVSSPAAATGATGYNVYVATASGQEVLQNGATPIPLGTAWTEPTSGLVTGTASAPQSGKVPDGAEAISNIQSLSRTYTNSAGQAVRQDDYFNLSGVAWSAAQYIGTQNTNYYTTQFDFDSRGRQYRTLTPTGTYYKTLYDGLGRMVSTWVGTNDGSPGNMTETAAYIYDGSQGAVTQTGGVGDGNLTQMIQYPGGSAANRVTNYWYDWRDRQVASKPGVQSSEDTTTHRPISYPTYDNLDEVTKWQRYDGDGVTLSVSGGVPQAPASSLLRAETDSSYDEQGRVYKQQVGKVDPVNGGSPSAFLPSYAWYNHRGLVIESRSPGGLATQYAYDGAGRLTATYQDDAHDPPGGPGNWSNAGTVGSFDNVLQQVEFTYDADGNVILTTTRQRFDSETTGGPLGNPTTAPLARVSYVADYYDTGNRLTTEVDVGSNGGSTYTRPSTPDARSATVLRTDTSYAGDSVQQVSLTGGPPAAPSP
jgi:YD repeat-containing protein